MPPISKTYILPLMPASPLKPEQLEEAASLKALFLAWQRRRKESGENSSQEFASEALGFNQSSLSQYLNGKIPMNIEAGVKFARLLGCEVVDFSPSVSAEILEAATLAGGARPDEMDVLTAFRLGDDAGRDALKGVAGSILNRLQKARRHK